LAKNSNQNNKFLEGIVSVPAKALEIGIESGEKLVKNLGNQPPLKKVKKFWASLGPGLTTGAADDDPSGIATYSQTGSQYGFSLLWLSAFTFPFMAVVQEMCARIGLVTGQGLAANIRKHFPPWVLYLCTSLLFLANTFNIGANLGAMATAGKLIAPSLNFNFLIILFGLVSLFLQIFVSYSDYAKYLKWLALILVAYIFSALSLNLDWQEILKNAFLPQIRFTKDQIFLICGILGTTISPYLFFWQTSQEVEEEILEGKTSILQRQKETSKEEIKKMRLDVWSGMFFSNLVMFFIIVTCAEILFKNGEFNIQTAAQAASALKPLAGQYASLLFGIGIIGTGLLAVPVLAGSTSYALSESFGWKQGLYRKLKKASAFYGIIIISIILGMLMNFFHADPIKTLIYSAVLNGLIAPVILILIVKISDNKKIMDKWANRPLSSTLGWAIAIIMILAGVATLASLMF
jgi:NRAMP (natural resistance-associated macrophage protein)-like metal ion transporter